MSCVFFVHGTPERKYEAREDGEGYLIFEYPPQNGDEGAPWPKQSVEDNFLERVWVVVDRTHIRRINRMCDA